MKPIDYLDLADRLSAGATEAEWRTGASRAYYASSHAARYLLEDLRFQVPQSERAHTYLSYRLSNCGVALQVAAGVDLIKLRRGRNAADYDWRRPFDRGMAVRAVADARRINAALDAARRSPTRALVRDAIRDYERDVLKEVTWRP